MAVMSPVPIWAKFNTAVTQSKDSLKALEPGPADSANKANAAMNAADSTWQGAKLRAALIKAATPYPDFWLPLNDSLDLEEGFGQVSFTRSTTATYVDKSGVLRTAGVNEPRFEREGVLIEGSSTNLNNKSETTFCGFKQEGKNICQDASDSAFTVQVSKVIFDGDNRQSIYNYNTAYDIAATLTFSCYLKKVNSDKIRIEAIGFGSTKTAEVNLVDGTNTGEKVGYRSEKMSNGWVKVSHTLTSTKDNKGNKGWLFRQVGTSAQYLLTCVQVEALPFATSYIPTSGSAVTRAADGFSITPLGNINPQGSAKTLYFDQHSYAYYSQPGVLIRLSSDAKPYRIFRKNENELLAGFIAAIDTTVNYKSGKLVTVFGNDTRLRVYPGWCINLNSGCG